MIRFLVADDEPQIRKGIRGLVVRTMGGEEKVEIREVEDGMAALETAMTWAPDILLLDIHMPRLRGLDLVEKLNALDQDWVIVVVTGHDEFEYARSALALRVFDFLLKPVPEEVFRKAVERAVEEWKKRKEKRQFLDWSRDRMVRQKTLNRNDILREWLEGRSDQGEFDRNCGYVGINLPDKPTILVIDGHLGYPLDGIGVSWALVVTDSIQNAVVIADRSVTGGWKAVAVRLAGELHRGQRVLPVMEGLDRNSPAELPEAWARLKDLVRATRSQGGLVQGALDFLETAYWNPDISLSTVADHLKVSPNYLSRLLKEATDRSFVNFLCHLRMEKAKTFLGDPRLRIAEVADRVGYRDQNYFCRHFKTMTGTTPKAWQTGHRTGDAP